MNISLAFIRIFFTLLSICFITIYTSHIQDGPTGIIVGIIIGLVFGFILIGIDMLFRRFNLRSFNIAVLGLFFGYLMGEALVLIFDAILKISMTVDIHEKFIEIIEIGIFLFGIYLGLIMTLRAADELYVSIPFVKFAPTSQKKKDLLIDTSVLADARIIDLSSSGVLDHHLVIPRFIIKELYSQAEYSDEMIKSRARRCLDGLKKLEMIPNLGIRYNDTDFPDVKEPISKLIRLARLIDANVITADISRIQMSSIEGVRIINIHSLANSLKPIMQAGERIKIKVQRYGKEPRQGIGYLEDGTMVVVNGGGEHIGQIIEAQVLSVKHTSSGRMIFCNAEEESSHKYGEMTEEEMDEY